MAASLCLFAGIASICLSWYYEKHFAVNTWVNGVYLTGKTVEAGNHELAKEKIEQDLIIKDASGQSWVIKPEEINFSWDYRQELQEYLETKDKVAWFEQIYKAERIEVKPVPVYNEALLQECFEQLPFVTEERRKEFSIQIVRAENGFLLKNDLGMQLNEEKALESIKSVLQKGETEVDLMAAGAYEEVVPDASQERILLQWEKVDTFQKQNIVYDMGEEKIVLSPMDLSQFLVTKEDKDSQSLAFEEREDGSLVVSEEAVTAFINQLADTYDTYGKERQFQATRGEVVTVPANGTYGTQLHRDAEIEYLYSALTGRVYDDIEGHIPIYKRKPYHRGLNDIGDTYIEIDMTDQKMYFYLEGECLVDTKIVTGNTGRRMGTPEGVNYVYAMQRNRTLRGADYAAFVNFWMPVKGNIGIHDANWRSSFGGSIYKTNGSHGCINTPYQNMKTIYENAQIGIPVVMFY